MVIKQLVKQSIDRKGRVNPNIFSVLAYYGQVSKDPEVLREVYNETMEFRGWTLKFQFDKSPIDLRYSEGGGVESSNIFKGLALNPNLPEDILREIANPSLFGFNSAILGNPLIKALPDRIALAQQVIEGIDHNGMYIPAWYFKNWDDKDLKLLINANKSLAGHIMGNYSNYFNEEVRTHAIRNLTYLNDYMLTESNLPSWVIDEILGFKPKTINFSEEILASSSYYNFFGNKSISNSQINKYCGDTFDKIYFMIQNGQCTNALAYKLIDFCELTLSMGNKLNKKQQESIELLLSSRQWRFTKFSKTYRERLEYMITTYSNVLITEKTAYSVLNRFIYNGDSLNKITEKAKELIVNLIPKYWWNPDKMFGKIPTQVILEHPSEDLAKVIINDRYGLSKNIINKEVINALLKLKIDSSTKERLRYCLSSKNYLKS